MKLCPFCETEAGGIGGGDEILDYCYECQRIIEGETITEEDLNEREKQLQQTWNQLDQDEQAIKEFCDAR